MSDMKIEENGKVYNLDPNTGLITEASVKGEATLNIAEPKSVVAEVKVLLGSRVEADGQLGEVVSKTNSPYGEVFGIRFDDQSVGEFVASQLTLSDIEPIDFATPINEVTSRYDAYEELPSYTKEEIEAKQREARWLNLRAKALITDKNTGLSDQIALDHIVVSTATDILDLKESMESADLAHEADYLSSFNEYEIGGQYDYSSGVTMGSQGDASWLIEAADDFEYQGTTEADLASKAVEIVSKFTREQLETPGFIKDAMGFQADYLNMDEDQQAAFAAYVDMARDEKLAEEPEAKIAAVEEDLDDFDTSALYV
jgi:hypothetical protein